jgi:hypothetical protein
MEKPFRKAFIYFSFYCFSTLLRLIILVRLSGVEAQLKKTIEVSSEPYLKKKQPFESAGHLCVEQQISEV